MTTRNFANVLPLELERHTPGDSRKASLAHIAVNEVEAADQDRVKQQLSLRKRTLNSPKLSQIRQLDTRHRIYLQDHATPWKGGVYLVAFGLVAAVDRQCRIYADTRDALADEAAAEYPSLVEQMRERLGPLFNPRDYLTPREFRAAFSVTWMWTDFSAPHPLEALDAEIFERERVKREQAAVEAQTLIQAHLRQTLHDITTHVHDLLTPKESGRLPQLRAGALDRLFEFMRTLESRDVANDAQLQEQVARLRAISSGLDVELLRDDKDLRARAEAEMAGVVEALGALVDEAPQRAIRFREDEDAA